VGGPVTVVAPADGDAPWREALAPYAEPRLALSVLNLASSVVPYLLLLPAIYLALRVSIVLALALAVPAAGFLVRTFIVFHDCAHGSFLPSKRAGAVLGAVLGVLLYMPFSSWRHKHAIHHATAGDLDRRGTGDIRTLTVAEYRAQPWWGRLAYRLFRSPLVMFGLGPLWVVVAGPRLVSPSASKRIRRSVIGTDVVLAFIVSGLCWLVGWQAFLLVQVPTLLLTGAVGIWLFYVQHQFEDTYWQSREAWSYDHAALRGSSYLKLPRILQFFTGNIGFHHVHHLSVRIPNYSLQRAHERTARLQAVPTLSLWEGLRASRLKLWDEQRQRRSERTCCARVRRGRSRAPPRRGRARARGAASRAARPGRRP
jgi:acyl-lipid omega-6 desaturase (Delta-12 desaturase)